MISKLSFLCCYPNQKGRDYLLKYNIYIMGVNIVHQFGIKGRQFSWIAIS
jgi:hypothetical protein